MSGWNPLASSEVSASGILPDYGSTSRGPRAFEKNRYCSYLVDMQNTKILKIQRLLAFVSIFLVACAASPELQVKSAVVPAGIDLSGRWQLRDEPGSRSRPPAAAEPGIRIPPATSSRNQKRASTRRSRGPRGTAVMVFLESGDSLKITQTQSGLFISFDRSVVEEYRFGEDRRVSVGPIEAHRVSGWQDGRFVTQTLDEAGAILTESWELVAAGEVLVRSMSISSGEDEIFSSLQRFDRL